jgi:hypothetical protein
VTAQLRKKGIMQKIRNIALAAGISAIAIFGACKKPEPENIRCYDYTNKTLHVHLSKKGNLELGTTHKISLSNLGFKDSNPLYYYCTRSGHLFWLTPTKIHVRRITRDNEGFSTREVISAVHTKPDEYKDPEVKIIDGHIGGDPTENWQKIRIATLSNTGIFQVTTLSLNSLAKDKPNRAIFNFMNDNDVDPKFRWPEKNTSGGIVRVLNNSEFSIIPFGIKGSGTVRNFYYLKVDGDLRSGDWSLGTMQPWKTNPKLKNIYKVETRYEEASGGHIGNFQCETNDNKSLTLLQTLTPYSE